MLLVCVVCGVSHNPTRGKWSNLTARILVSLFLECSILSQAKKHGVPGIKDFPSRVQGFGGGGKYSGEAERAASPKDYISVLARSQKLARRNRKLCRCQ